MQLHSDQIRQLGQQYLDGTLLPEQWALYKAYLLSAPGHPELEELLQQMLEKETGEQQRAAQLPNHVYADPAVLQHILQTVKAYEEGETAAAEPIPEKKIHWLRTHWWAAAVFLLLAGAGWYLMVRSSHKAVPQPTAMVQQPAIEPGKAGAILTLASGQTIVLDSAGEGALAQEAGAAVVMEQGVLNYEQQQGAAAVDMAYNTITTPKGRQFSLRLSDGTQVWLNAASSIRYPAVFTGHERRVEVTGEAYFEVTKNVAMPFRVKVNNSATVEVLGTHFNINAYDNETAIRTTLLEGKVRMTGNFAGSAAKGHSVVLQPGQQAVLTHAQQHDLVINKTVDTDKVMAWKNGLFNFEGASLQEVMRQLERWYDIEVVYEKGVPNPEFVGKMTKDIPLSGLLVVLEKSDVHFKLEGRKLIVLQ